MIIFIAGASHVGKTKLAQRMLERLRYPTLSIDHVKMGLIRAGLVGDLTADADDDAITAAVWPVVREIVKTAIENNQNLIVEGSYIPPTWRDDFTWPYLQRIVYCCLAMTPEYIRANMPAILMHADDIERRLDDSWVTQESLIADNLEVLRRARRHELPVTLIGGDETYDDVIARTELELTRACLGEF
ncbi:MAG: hypothetical protein UHD09_07170 [Bifidobacterium sp.]|nr:hypothetical protein [Bifidobacterium sp.]